MFATLDELVLATRDEMGRIIEIPMGPDEDGIVHGFHVTDFAPHAVINRSDDAGVLYEAQNWTSSNYHNFEGTDQTLILPNLAVPEKVL
ncbi:MAG TPA: hypothetical protein VJR27_02380 [Candidatus Saccharimonadales bacterium]|nr:hypothetical protein [Candidatus Saccharimonadales bacterium]